MNTEMRLNRTNYFFLLARLIDHEEKSKHTNASGWCYRSPNIVRVIKSRRLRSAGHVAGMEEGRSVFKILTGKQYRKETFGEA